MDLDGLLTASPDTFRAAKGGAECPQIAKSVRTGWPRYLLFLEGRWRWRPTKTMRAHGFGIITFGKALTDEAIAHADHARRC
jgi:hypothetical protein